MRKSEANTTVSDFFMSKNDFQTFRCSFKNNLGGIS